MRIALAVYPYAQEKPPQACDLGRKVPELRRMERRITMLPRAWQRRRSRTGGRMRAYGLRGTSRIPRSGIIRQIVWGMSMLQIACYFALLFGLLGCQVRHMSFKLRDAVFGVSHV